MLEEMTVPYFNPSASCLVESVVIAPVLGSILTMISSPSSALFFTILFINDIHVYMHSSAVLVAKELTLFE